jgi:hypothetical protein
MIACAPRPVRFRKSARQSWWSYRPVFPAPSRHETLLSTRHSSKRRLGREAASPAPISSPVIRRHRRCGASEASKIRRQGLARGLLSSGVLARTYAAMARSRRVTFASRSPFSTTMTKPSMSPMAHSTPLYVRTVAHGVPPYETVYRFVAGSVIDREQNLTLIVRTRLQ